MKENLHEKRRKEPREYIAITVVEMRWLVDYGQIEAKICDS